MNIFRILKLLVILFLFNSASSAEEPKSQTKPPAPFAVVELFTSEGCSSCPPADAFLKNLTIQALKEKRRIYTLSFHVDYWNELGWVDPFSKKEFTRRQNQYAQLHNSKNVYTPQIVVNGAHALPGNNIELAINFINMSLMQPPKSSLKLHQKREILDDTLWLNYDVEPLLPKCELHIVLVERNLNSDVTRGGNAGRRLKHDNVVREFKTINLKDSKGTVTMEIPKGVNLKNASIIAVVQNKKTMIMEAAHQFKIRTRKK